MINKHHGLCVAEAVLNILNTMELPDDVQKNAYVVVFDNCREQGYVINYWNLDRPKDKANLHIAFSENRNSDDIVVYEYYEIAFPRNTPREDQWDNKKYFKYNEHYQAAEHIAGILKSHATPVKEKQNV